LLLAAPVVGCAFSPGDPWGRLDATLVLSTAPMAARQDASGSLATALDYRVRLDRIEVQGGELEVRGTSGEGTTSTTTFDPAHPPEGYTLCHGGHCHTTDGRLVPYEEVTGASGGPTEVPWQAIPWKEEAVGVPVAGSTEVVLEACPDDCPLPEGTLSGVQVALEGITLEGRVFDARTGEARRLPDAGWPFRGSLEAAVRVSGRLSTEVGPGHPLRVALHVTLSLPPNLLDGVDFAGLPSDGQVLDLHGAQTEVAEALAAATLDVDTGR